MKKALMWVIVCGILVPLYAQAVDILKSAQALRFPKPTATLENVTIENISLEEIALRVDTMVQNPYPVSLPKLFVDSRLTIEGTQLLNAVSSPFNVPAYRKAAVPFHLKIRFQDLLGIYQKASSKEALSLGLKGNIGIPLPVSALKSKGLWVKGMLTEVKIPFSAQKLLPAVLPSVSIQNFKITAPTSEAIQKAMGAGKAKDQVSKFLSQLLSSTTTSPISAAQAGLASVDLPLDVEFDIALHNQAASRIQFENMGYDLLLKGEKFVSGRSQHVENKGKDSVVTVKTQLPIRSIGEKLFAAIQQRRAPFSLKGNSEIILPALGPAGKIPFQFSNGGELKW